MRFSLRNAVRLTAFIGFILFLNILFFAQHDESRNRRSEKLGDSPRKVEVNNGGSTTLVEDGFRNIDSDFLRKQRSAKSIPEDVHKIARQGDVPNLTETEKKLVLDRKNQEMRTELSDIFISVKTSKQFHNSRLQLILKTWFTLARSETYFFTDEDDAKLQASTGGRVINTNCGPEHNRQALCCKMSVEYDTYLDSNKRWFCHVDDDTYVNIPRLLKVLQKYNHLEDWYLGKPSLKHPMEIQDRNTPGLKIAYWFATGGAGFCISRGLALKMMPHASGGRLMTVGNNIRLPDDCTVGYIINYVLGKDLTVVDGFHSHLEALGLIRPSTFNQQITLSYSKYKGTMNTVHVPGFSEMEDPSRFHSIHCHLFPTVEGCENIAVSP